MGVSLFDELPAEIRLYIFRLATIKISQHEDTHLDYRPFEAVGLYDRDWSSSAQEALNVKRTIVLVSKEWKKIATEMLYECIRVGHGTEELIAALEGPLSEDGENTFDNGRWVRRIEISPDILDFDPFNPLPLLRIMKSSPLAEAIVRPCVFVTGGPGLGKVRLDPEVTFPTFPSVKRIEWWLPSSMPSMTDDKTMGLPGFLGELVRHSPNLQYLTLSGAFNWRRWPERPATGLVHLQEYASITTFRLEGEDGSVPLRNVEISLPNLRHLVLGVVNTPAQWILKRNGRRVRVLELINVHFPPYAQHSEVSVAWSTKEAFTACPNIEELCVSLDMGDILAKQNVQVVLNTLKCIRIKLDSWSPVQAAQFGVFVRDRLTCPALERIILYGKEDVWKENVCYPVLKDYMARLKYGTLEFAQG